MIRVFHEQRQRRRFDGVGFGKFIVVLADNTAGPVIKQCRMVFEKLYICPDFPVFL